MFFTKAEHTLYLTSFEYNLALILDNLSKIIDDNGGRVKPATPGYIINRSFYEAAREEEKRAEATRHYIDICNADAEKAAKLEKSAAEHIATAEEYTRKGDASKRPAEHLSYINFIYEGHYYSLYRAEIEHKLCFHKTPINDRGEFSRDTYGDDISTAWLTDEFYRLFPERAEIDSDRREAANLIFNELTTAPASEKYREGRKTRVPNTYNSGYHYETIYKPERVGKIDF